jgi:hypothetical protein
MSVIDKGKEGWWLVETMDQSSPGSQGTGTGKPLGRIMGRPQLCPKVVPLSCGQRGPIKASRPQGSSPGVSVRGRQAQVVMKAEKDSQATDAIGF